MSSDNRYRLIVFDWDGTLMDSEARIVSCIELAAKDLGLPQLERDAIRNIIGLGLREAVNALFPEADEALHKGMVEGYRRYYLESDLAPSQMFEGAVETVQALSDAGYLLAVATGKSRRGLEQSLAQSGIADLFHATRCADESFSKPNPQMMLDVLELTGSEAHETLMIGDTEYDLQMAHNAGTDALAVSYGVHELERLLQQNPVGAIDAIAELLPWLEQRLAGKSEATG